MEKICQRCHKTHEEIKDKQLECHDDQGNYFDKHDWEWLGEWGYIYQQRRCKKCGKLEVVDQLN